MEKEIKIPDEPAHFAIEHSGLIIKKCENGKIKISYKQEDDGGQPMVVPDDIIRIAILRVREEKTQLFKTDKWINTGNQRIGKLGPTLIFKKEDLEELIEDLIQIFKKHNL